MNKKLLIKIAITIGIALITALSIYFFVIYIDGAVYCSNLLKEFENGLLTNEATLLSTKSNLKGCILHLIHGFFTAIVCGFALFKVWSKK